MRARRVAIAGIAALALLAVLLLYLLFPSAAYTGDGTLFADLVRNYGNDQSTEYYRLFFHPHHLAYGRTDDPEDGGRVPIHELAVELGMALADGPDDVPVIAHSPP